MRIARGFALTQVLIAAAVVGVLALTLATALGARPLEPADLFRTHDLDEARFSPDGAWLAYAPAGAARCTPACVSRKTSSTDRTSHGSRPMRCSR